MECRGVRVNLIPLPYRILISVVLLLGMFAAGLWMGKDYGDTTCTAGQVKAQTKAITAADKETTRREIIGTAREASAEQIRIVYRTIKEQAHENIASHPELNTCGLDADGLRLWNAANSGAAASLPGEPYLSLHRAATSQVGDVAGSVEQPHRGNGDVQGLPGQAGQAGGVR